MQIKRIFENPWPAHGPRSLAGRPAAEDPAGAPGVSSAEKTRSACAEMESLFLYHLLREMQDTVPKSGLLGGGTTAALYTDMLHQHLSRDLAAGGGIGLADILMTQLSGNSGCARNPTSDEK